MFMYRTYKLIDSISHVQCHTCTYVSVLATYKGVLAVHRVDLLNIITDTSMYCVAGNF